MKKLLFLPIIFSLFFTSCCHQGVPSKDGYVLQTRTYRTTLLSDAEVKELKDRYAAEVKADPTKAMKTVNMSGAAMRDLGRYGFNIKYHFGMDKNLNPVMIIQLYNDLTEESKYCLADEFFDASQPGSLNRPILCPPPNPCDIPSITPAKKSE